MINSTPSSENGFPFSCKSNNLKSFSDICNPKILQSYTVKLLQSKCKSKIFDSAWIF